MTVRLPAGIRHVLVDWGNTLMEDSGLPGPMCTWEVVRAVPGARAMLERLSWRYSLHIATNADESDGAMVRAALARAGLDRHIDLVFSSKDIGFRKPQREFYVHVLECLGAPPEEVAMVGDGLDNDVIAPAALGICAIWFDRKGVPAVPVSAARLDTAAFAQIRSLDELDG